MLNIGRRVGLVCEKLTALQACAAKVAGAGAATGTGPGVQAFAAAAAGAEMPGLPK